MAAAESRWPGGQVFVRTWATPTNVRIHSVLFQKYFKFFIDLFACFELLVSPGAATQKIYCLLKHCYNKK